MQLNKKFVLPPVILLLGVATLVLLKLTRAQQPPAEIQERVWRVQVQQAALRTLSPSLTLYGRVETPAVLKAAAPGEAVVDQVRVKEGQRVAAGALLVQLDERDFLPAVEQARADVNQLAAEIASEQGRHQADLEALRQEREILSLARAAVDRAERLQKKNLGSESALDEARQNVARQALTVISRQYNIGDHDARLKQLEARLARARAQSQEAELNLERSRLVAPFDGVVAQVKVAPGDRVRKADVMLQLYAPATLEVRARIPAPYRDELQSAFDAGRPVEAWGARGGIEIRLQLERLSGEADPRGVDGLFRITQGGGALRLGEVLELQLRRPPRERALALPYQALYGSDRIYLLEDGRMRSVEVESLGSFRGESGDEYLVVASDAIRDGDAVVTTHLPNAITGLRAQAVP